MIKRGCAIRQCPELSYYTRITAAFMISSLNRTKPAIEKIMTAGIKNFLFIRLSLDTIFLLRSGTCLVLAIIDRESLS